MAGTPDRLVEHGGTPDAVRPTEDRGMRTALRDRLEQLPTGHPSSPYEHDGTKKPPVPNLADHERPFPDDRAYDAAETVDHDGDSAPDEWPDQNSTRLEPVDHRSEAGDDRSTPEDPPTIGEDGSWEWKGRHLTPEQSRIADKALERFRVAEGRDETGAYGDHGITPTMRRIESQLEHGKLVDRTEEFALKSPDRFKEKLAKFIIDEPGAGTSEIIERINDGIRYTYIFDDEHYSNGVIEVGKALTEVGFDARELKNSWADYNKSYQGVNSTWAHEGGHLFEVQIHTQASWDAKQESHRAYEVIESQSSTPEERREAKELQDKIFASVPIPHGVLDIRTYRQVGL